MKHLIYMFLCLSTLICILLSMSGCSQKPVPDHESGNTEAPVTEDGSVQGPEDSVYDWEEIGENGVDSKRGYRKDGSITNLPLYLAGKTREFL